MLKIINLHKPQSLALLLLLASCGKQVPQNQATPEKAPISTDLRLSFSSEDDQRPISTGWRVDAKSEDSGLRAQDSEFLVIKKTALNSDFLMSASLIPQSESPTSSGLQGRIVNFKRFGKRLFMLESTEGHVISPTLPASLILAEIPVVEERADELVVDFNKGMSTVFVEGNWWGSDFDGKKYDGKNRSAGLPVEVSYIDSIKTVGAANEILEIRQIAQVKVEMATEMFPTFEVRYYLRAYKKNPNFTPKESSGDFTHLGYFQTNPSLERVTGRSKLYATLFDISQPITYYVSANTPAEYREAVKEGILYWNKAFGKEVLRAEIAPEGVSAPDPLRNLVQWVEFDNAGFAYADALMDPRTGEIKHSQIYLTSAFAVASKYRARQLLRQLSAEAATKTVKDPKKDSEETSHDYVKHKHGIYLPLSIRGLSGQALCDADKSNALVAMIEAVLAAEGPNGEGLTDAAILRASQDYVRDVTAHEVGHTLGLRHNFAGNLGSTYSQTERGEVIQKYLARAELDNVDKSMPATSVMEYTDFLDGIISGALMKRRKEAYPYDTKAIQYAYVNEKIPVNDGILFCTDSHADQFLDCTRHDSGKNLLEHYASNISEKLNKEAFRFVEVFLAAKSNLVVVDRVPVERVVVSPSSANYIGEQTALALKWLNAKARSLTVERKFDRLDSINKEEVLAARLNEVKSLVKAMGGKPAALFLTALNTEKMGADKKELESHNYRVPENFSEDFLAKVSAYLSRPDVRKFIGPDGQTFELSEQEVKYIEAHAKKYAEKFVLAANLSVMAALRLAKIDLEAEVTDGKLPRESLTEALEERIAEVAGLFVGSIGGTDTIKYRTAQFVVPKYSYEHELRLESAKALAAPQAPLPQWNESARKTLKKNIVQTLSQSLNVEDILKMDPATFDGNRPFQVWLADHIEILKSLGIPL